MVGDDRDASGEVDEEDEEGDKAEREGNTEKQLAVAGYNGSLAPPDLSAVSIPSHPAIQ